MKNRYAALVALDWGDKTHAFAYQATGRSECKPADRSQPEALHAWLEQ